MAEYSFLQMWGDRVDNCLLRWQREALQKRGCSDEHKNLNFQIESALQPLLWTSSEVLVNAVPLFLRTWKVIHSHIVLLVFRVFKGKSYFVWLSFETDVLGNRVILSPPFHSPSSIKKKQNQNQTTSKIKTQNVHFSETRNHRINIPIHVYIMILDLFI